MPRGNTKQPGNAAKWVQKAIAVEKMLRSWIAGGGKRELAELGALFEDAGNHYLDLADEIRTAVLKAKGNRSARKASKRKSGK